MTALRPDEMRAAIERHIALWNAGEKEPWLAAWRTVSSGGVTAEDPVGTPMRQGPDVFSDLWDHTVGVWTLTVEHLVACANEVAMVVRNEGTVGGENVTVRSIELYRFGEDETLSIRTYFDQP